MPMKGGVSLYDPHYDTFEPWWGKARHHDDTNTFLIEEADDLSERSN